MIYRMKDKKISLDSFSKSMLYDMHNMHYSTEEVPHFSMISTSLELCQYKSMSFPSCFKNLTSISIDVDFDKITS